MLLEIKQIAAIIGITRLRSYKLAAEALNTTQPTLSRLITNAEAKLGVTLFQRGWSGAETTPQGDIVGHHCLAIISAINTVEANIFSGRRTHPTLCNTLRSHQLEAIDAVVRMGSASGAAKELSCSQPAISRSITSFSNFFAIKLFDRTSYGLNPSQSAYDLATLHRIISYHLDQLTEGLTETEGEVVGRVAIGMLPFSGQEIISKVFAQLTNQHPKIRLVCVPGSYESLVEALRQKKIDRIVGILRGEALGTGLRENYLYDESFTLVANKDHEVHKNTKSITQLKNHNWIVAPHGTPVRTYFEKLFSDSGAVPPTQTCEILSFSAAEQMIIESNSIALLNYSQARLHSLRPELKRIELTLPDATVPIGLTELEGCFQEQAIEEFERLLSNKINSF